MLRLFGQDVVAYRVPMIDDEADLKVGVVGLGKRSNLARGAHRPGRGARVVAVADPDREALARSRDWFGDGVVETVDHRDLVDMTLDAVMIMTPDHTHEDLAVEFLDAGVAVYLEKPMAITIDGCDRILAAARRTGARIYVGHNMRHMPVVLLMRELIERGEIGEVKAVWCRHFVGRGGEYYFKDWHAERRHTNSLLLQKGSHDIDVIHWLAGGYTRRVTAMGGLTVFGQRATDTGDGRGGGRSRSNGSWRPSLETGLNPKRDVEDLEMVTMELSNGVFATYQQCQYTPDYWRNYTVIGTEGRLENFGDTKPGSVVRVWNAGPSEYRPEGDLGFHVQSSAGGHGGADNPIVDEFLSFVRHGGKTNTSPIAARHSVATGVMAATSLRNDSVPLEVPFAADDHAAYFDAGQPVKAHRPCERDPWPA